MAWLHVVDGINIELRGGYKDKDKIEEAPKYKDFEKKLQDIGCMLGSEVNENGEISFFAGVEMLESRNIYQGQTKVIGSKGWPDGFEDIAKEFKVFLEGSGLEIISSQHGIILSCFD